MTKLFIYLIFSYLSIIISESFAKVILKIHLYNYKNIDDLLYNSKKCENFHWAGDYCDPIFKVCVTSTKKCDIIKSQTIVHNNRKHIYEVFSKSVYLDSFQKSVSVDVTVDDSDSNQVENIANFKANFQLEKSYSLYYQNMKVVSKNKNVFIQASVQISCFGGFIGDKCEYTIEQYQCIKRCIHGKCIRNQLKNDFECLCDLNWNGRNCDNFISFEKLTTSSSVLMKTFTTALTTKNFSKDNFTSRFPTSISTSPKGLKISIKSNNYFYTSNLFSTSNVKSSIISKIRKSTISTFDLSKLSTYSTKVSPDLQFTKSADSNSKNVSIYYKSHTNPVHKIYSRPLSTKRYVSNLFLNEKKNSILTNSDMTTKNSISDLIDTKSNILNMFTSHSGINANKKNYFQTKKSNFNKKTISTENSKRFPKKSTETFKTSHSGLYIKSTGIMPFILLSKSVNLMSSNLQSTITNNVKPVHSIIQVNSSTHRPINIEESVRKSSLFHLFSQSKNLFNLENNSLHKSTRLHQRHSVISILNNTEFFVTSRKMLTTQKIKLSKSSLIHRYFIRSTAKNIFLATISKNHENKVEIQTSKQKRMKNINEKQPSVAERLKLALKTTPKVIFICFSAWFAMIMFLIIITILKVKKRKQIKKRTNSNKSINSSLPKQTDSLKLCEKVTSTVKSLDNKDFSKYESILINLDNQNREII